MSVTNTPTASSNPCNDKTDNHGSVNYRNTHQSINGDDATIPRSFQTTDWRDATNPATPDNRPVQFNLRELASIAPTFDPSEKSGPTSKQWINKIEELREVYDMNDKMTLLLASSNLAGAARFWLQASQAKITNWNQMKTELLSAFPTVDDESEVHLLLSKRKKLQHEPFEQYFFEMMAIANRVPMTNQAKLRYIINGITNNDIRMTLSLQCFKSPEELLWQYKHYEDVLRLQPQQRVQSPTSNKGDKSNNNVKCFNCNELGHISLKCPKPQRKQRCSKCFKTGHVEKDCQHVAKGNKISLIRHDEYHKPVIINERHKTIAFFDMGSDVSIMKVSFANICELAWEPFTISLNGFGNGRCHTIGRVNIKLSVDLASAKIFVLIVDDHLMQTDFLLGRDFIDLSHIVVVKRKGSLTIKNKDSESTDEDVKDLKERKLCQMVRSKQTNGHSPAINDINLNEINFGDISEKQRVQLKDLINKFRKCFALNVFELGCSRNSRFQIRLKNSTIVNCLPYRLSYAQRAKMQSIVQELLRAGIIQESNSEYSSPALLVKKKDGDDRMVVDYRRINEMTIKDRHPLPVIEDLLQQLNGSKHFIVLDFASGYYQIPVSEESRKFTAFVTPDGEFEFTRMPFGLSNCPSQFQRLMNNLKRRVHSGQIVVYMDDVLIPCESFEHGITVLTEFLNIILEEGLTLKLKKSYFFKSSVEFLGYEISSEGVRPDHRKTSAVREFNTPQNIHEIRQFVGLTNYFRRFVPEYGIIIRPLTELLRKNEKYDWREKQQRAFNTLKDILTSRPLLTLFNPNLRHEVHTDACSSGLAGILLQREADGTLRPVSYFSRRTSDEEKFYHSYELEVLAVVETLTRFRTFLLGKHFKVVTDCQAIKMTAKKKDIIPRIARWWLRLSDFDFDIEYRKGRLIQHVDCLSRNPHDPPRIVEEMAADVFSLSIEDADWLFTIQIQDKELASIVSILRRTPTNNEEKQIHADYVIKNYRLYRKTKDGLRWVVPRGAISRIIRTCHDDLSHHGLEKTLEVLKRSYWFRRMRNKTKTYISSCVNCAYYKQPQGRSEAELHPIEKVAIPFHTIHVDHLGPFPKSPSGNTHILGVEDGYTKYTLLYPVKNTSTRATLRIMENVISYFGTPTRVITDRGTAFTSKDFKNFCKDNCIHHILIATRTPRGNGQIERCNRTVLSALRTMAEGDENWDTLLKRIQWSLNSTRSQSTKRTPHELLFGFQPRDPLQNKVLLALHDDNLQGPSNLEELRNEAAENILRSQKAQKLYFDRKRKPAKKYQKDDLVLIKGPLVSTGDSRKLEARYKGPYIISEVLPNDRYRVKDIPGAPRTQRPFESVFAADSMKPWCLNPEDDLDSDDKTDDEGSEDESFIQDGRSVSERNRNNSTVGTPDEPTAG